jgi:phosphoribosylformimino-5-aminoimidazole carboxamide ribotide isomerase
MTAYAAVDLRGGRVVQLVGGRPGSERVSLADPVAIACYWVELGFAALHVVDLDAALGAGSNLPDIEAILAAVSVPVQVGGGIRSTAAADRLLAAGAARVVVGTRALEEPGWLDTLSRGRPDRVTVAADVRNRRVVTRGWTQESELDPESFLASLDALPLAAVLVTDVDREGQMLGADIELFRRLARATRHPLLASGGIASIEDLTALEEAGAAGAVLGMALYTAKLDPVLATRVFAA